MIRYADDFVVLCRSQEEAEAALSRVRKLAEERGLTLHPEKTRLVDATIAGQGFDFLGYHFEQGQRFVVSGTGPSPTGTSRTCFAATCCCFWKGRATWSLRPGRVLLPILSCIASPLNPYRLTKIPLKRHSGSSFQSRFPRCDVAPQKNCSMPSLPNIIISAIVNP